MVLSCSQTLSRCFTQPLLTPRLKDTQKVQQLPGRPDGLQSSDNIKAKLIFVTRMSNSASENLQQKKSIRSTQMGQATDENAAVQPNKIGSILCLGHHHV